jgi:hypothetical protein
VVTICEVELQLGEAELTLYRAMRELLINVIKRRRRNGARVDLARRRMDA